MKHRKNLFSVLEKIEKKKIEIESIKIKTLYHQKIEHDKQLKLLINYQNEYKEKLYNQKLLGIFSHNWNNYNNFLFVLSIIIDNNIEMASDNKKKIQYRIHILLKNQIKLKTWELLKNK
ncbi:Flagellar FliJ protein [Buchnera aphidicola (Cavariella theobaldi)]